MKLLIVALILLMIAPAMAQMSMPTTLPLTNNKTGETIGTATLFGNRMVLRKSNGEFIATVVIERDGSKTLYDENGKVLDQIKPKAKP